MAAGVPLVATAVGGLPSLLEGGAGLLVPPADPQALAAAFERLLEDRAACAALGMQGRARVNERYSFDGMVDRIQGIYDAVLAEQRGRAFRASRHHEETRQAGQEAA
jgi:glycosyltransferase involved in cell wall biosynthesis